MVKWLIAIFVFNLHIANSQEQATKLPITSEETLVDAIYSDLYGYVLLINQYPIQYLVTDRQRMRIGKSHFVNIELIENRFLQLNGKGYHTYYDLQANKLIDTLINKEIDSMNVAPNRALFVSENSSFLLTENGQRFDSLKLEGVDESLYLSIQRKEGKFVRLRTYYPYLENARSQGMAEPLDSTNNLKKSFTRRTIPTGHFYPNNRSTNSWNIRFPKNTREIEAQILPLTDCYVILSEKTNKFQAFNSRGTLIGTFDLPQRDQFMVAWEKREVFYKPGSNKFWYLIMSNKGIQFYEIYANDGQVSANLLERRSFDIHKIITDYHTDRLVFFYKHLGDARQFSLELQ